MSHCGAKSTACVNGVREGVYAERMRWSRLSAMAITVRLVFAFGTSGVSFIEMFGIGLGIFFRGETQFMTGILIAPELPLEEVFFLTLLCYLTMNVFRGVHMLLMRRGAGSGA